MTPPTVLNSWKIMQIPFVNYWKIISLSALFIIPEGRTTITFIKKHLLTPRPGLNYSVDFTSVLHQNTVTIVTIQIPKGGVTVHFWVLVCRETLEPLLYTRPCSTTFCNPAVDRAPKVPTLSLTRFFLQPCLHTTDQSPGKWYSILDQNSLISIPYRRQNRLKTIPQRHIYPYSLYMRVHHQGE